MHDLPQLLRRGDLLVVNDSRVLPARLFGHKRRGGGRVEILLVRPLGSDRWAALVRPGRRLREGAEVELEGGPLLQVGALLRGGLREVNASELLGYAEHFGHVPLPPYLDRPDDAADRERYQTVFADETGSVAAPTAGLHFDATLLDALTGAGIELAKLTLHVGLGTFAPLDAQALRDGTLHAESYTIPSATLSAIEVARSAGRRIVAVGTTSCRALESHALQPGGPWPRSTQLFIQPGFRFRVVDALLTNFHLPCSSLLLLVAAFAGERWREAYALAIREGYRFYSYGDANLIERSAA